MGTAFVYTFVLMQHLKLCGSSHVAALLLLLTWLLKLHEDETT